MSLWKKIVKHEIRLKTYRYRNNRVLFLVIIYAIFLYWGFYLGPNLFNIIISNIAQDIPSEYLSISVKFIEYFLTTFFLIILIYPLYSLYRKAEIGHSQILLASPIKAGDIFLGEFLGKLIFYVLLILGFGPVIISLLNQIQTLNILQYIVIYLSLFMLLAFSFLIGLILANLLEHRMTKSTIAKDLGKSFLLLLSIIVIALFYILRVFFDLILSNPKYKMWLMFYPSFWYSNVILFGIDPSLNLFNSLSNYLYVVANMSLGIVIPFLLLYFSYKKADTFYSLEGYTENEIFINKKEGRYYKLIRKITPKKWEGLIITQFKQFLRKKENLFKIIYIAALISVIGVIIIYSLENPSLAGYDILNLKLLVIIIVSWIGGLLFGVLMGIHIFIDSKQILFQYKSTLRGVKALVYSYIYEIFYLILIMDIILTFIFTLLFQLELIYSLIFFISFMVFCFVIQLQAIGVQCLNPLFEERGKHAYLISYFVILLQVVSFFITLIIFIPFTSDTINNSLGLMYILLINLAITSGFSILIIILGLNKIQKLE
ncbi:MAG: hypothetical protein ACW96X_01725 [Promethearchaeota archaeon]|jgi:hypothetical protein